VDLHIEGEHMAAQVGQDAVIDEDAPERPPIGRPDLPLVGTGEAVDREDRVMPEDEFVARVGVRREGPVEPVGLHAPLAAVSRPEGVDEDQQQIAPPHPVR
jgi:hypothetical protein